MKIPKASVSCPFNQKAWLHTPNQSQINYDPYLPEASPGFQCAFCMCPYFFYNNNTSLNSESSVSDSVMHCNEPMLATSEVSNPKHTSLATSAIGSITSAFFEKDKSDHLSPTASSSSFMSHASSSIIETFVAPNDVPRPMI